MPEKVPFASANPWWNQATRWLALTGGVVSPILFVVGFTILGFLRPGYSPVRQTVSDLGVGTDAWLQNANFVIFGVLQLAFAIGFSLGMRQVLRKGWLVTCLVLLILAGVGSINTGIFTEAPATVTLHWTLGFLLSGPPLVVVWAIVGWQWRRVSRWRGYGWYSLLTALGTGVCILLLFAFLAPRSPVSGAHIGGLLERVLGLVVLAWFVVVGWRLFVLAGSHRRGGMQQEQKSEPEQQGTGVRDGDKVWSARKNKKERQ